MKNNRLILTMIMAVTSILQGQPAAPGNTPITSPQIKSFLARYPKFNIYENELLDMYRDRESLIWFDKNGIIEYARVLANGLNQIEAEGIAVKLPYSDKISNVFNRPAPGVNTDLFLTCAYLFYYKHVYGGLDAKASAATGWHLPREKRDLHEWLDSVTTGAAPTSGKPELFSQYYALRKALQLYRDIESRGGWQTVPDLKSDVVYHPGDSVALITAVRKRLYTEGFLERDSNKATYDPELQKALLAYRRRHGLGGDTAITRELIASLNVPVLERIRTIAVNMERCRWVPSSLYAAGTYIAVNIPSYTLHYVSDGRTELVSNVIVGKEVTKTVIFSGELTSIVFSPYWYVPQSILEKEIRPALKKDPMLLSRNDMEWSNGKLRQRPGPKNALGSVKFVFPNSNSIYLHDTPSRSLFAAQRRAFSHGCVRVEKARELAQKITIKDGGWTAEKSEAAMRLSYPTVYTLRQKIPVYIAYFTAWAQPDGEVAFLDDVYHRDVGLADLLFCE